MSPASPFQQQQQQQQQHGHHQQQQQHPHIQQQQIQQIPAAALAVAPALEVIQHKGLDWLSAFHLPVIPSTWLSMNEFFQEALKTWL